jgi:hypothetical protein
MNAVSCEAVNQSMILLYEKQGMGGRHKDFCRVPSVKMMMFFATCILFILLSSA